MLFWVCEAEFDLLKDLLLSILAVNFKLVVGPLLKALPCCVYVKKHFFFGLCEVLVLVPPRWI